jgi:hypothetical protein
MRTGHAEAMNLLQIKRSMAVLWVVSIVTLGLVGQVTSVTNWLAIVALVVLPPTILMFRWQTPQPSTSERVQDALR